MNEANTNTQSGQDLQNLQPQASHAQQTTSGLQTGAGTGSLNNEASSLLNQSLVNSNLRVGVANASSQTSIAPAGPMPQKADSAVGPMFYVALLFLFIAFALVVSYRRTRRLNEDVSDNTRAEDLLKEISKVRKTKKKRKKPKKAHHR